MHKPPRLLVRQRRLQYHIRHLDLHLAYPCAQVPPTSSQAEVQPHASLWDGWLVSLLPTALNDILFMTHSACLISILRLYSLYVIADSPDVTWDNVEAATWSSGELNAAIICACLPTLKPIIGRLYPRFLHHHHSQRNNQLELLGEPLMQLSLGREADGGPDAPKNQCRSESHHLEDLHWGGGNIVIAMAGEDEERCPGTPEVHRKTFV